MDSGLFGPARVKTRWGGLRLLSAREVLEARREGDRLTQDRINECRSQFGIPGTELHS